MNLLLGSSIIQRWNLPNFYNYGISGLTTDNLIQYLPILPTIAPKNIIFYCGCNDVRQLTNMSIQGITVSIQQFTNVGINIINFLTFLTKKYPTTNIICILILKSPICSNYQLNAINWINNIMLSLRQLNPLVDLSHPSNIMFIEMNSLTIDDYLPDKIHLKPSGYQKIENFIFL